MDFFCEEAIVGFKRKHVKNNLLLMVISSKNTLLVVLLKMHGVPHFGNNSLVLFAQRIRPDCPYSDHRVWSFQIGLELPVCWVGRVFKDPS